MKTNDTVKLFMLFRAKYGYKWANSYADPEVTRLAVSVWTDELKDFPDSWIKNGTDN